MNRRDILSSLSLWAAAASAAERPIPTSVEGWPTKALPGDAAEKTKTLPMDVKVHHVPPEKTLLVFRLTQCIHQEGVESIRENLQRWVRQSRLDCAAVLLPYGLELEVHRIPAGASPADVSVSKE